MKIKILFFFTLFSIFIQPALSADSKSTSKTKKSSSKKWSIEKDQGFSDPYPFRPKTSRFYYSSRMDILRPTDLIKLAQRVLDSQTHLDASTSEGQKEQKSRSLASTEQSGQAARQRFDEEHCSTENGKKSCGNRFEWADRGDPDFEWDAHMNQLKRGMPFTIEIKCNPDDKLFYTNVYHCESISRSGENCPEKDRSYFRNPYSTCRVKPNGFELCEPDYHSRSLFSSKPQNWRTSPGIYLPKEETEGFKRFLDGRIESMRASDPERAGILSRAREKFRSPMTDIPNVISRTEGGNDAIKLILHDQWQAGSGSLYAGYPTQNILWLKANGNAIHGSEHVNGMPLSQGCLRIHQENSIALYNLARKVGSRNFTVKWGDPSIGDRGYGPPDSTGRPACARPERQNRRLALLSFELYARSGRAAEKELYQAWSDYITRGSRLAERSSRTQERSLQ